MSDFDKLLPHCTVRLVGIIGGEVVSTGTGFFYFFNDTLTNEFGNLNENGTTRLGIVTNRHVVEGMDEVIFYLNTSEEGQPGYQMDELRVSLGKDTLILHPENDIDLCVILTHGIIQRLRDKNRKMHIYPVRKNIRIDESKYKEMSTIQNLLMIGYPNGIWDSVNNLPIIRKGINATPLYENYQGEEAIAVDIATYRGSSGSPVFLYNDGAYIENNEVKFGKKLSFIGVIKAAHLTTKKHSDEITTEEMLHIGIAIKANKIDVFEELIRKHYER